MTTTLTHIDRKLLRVRGNVSTYMDVGTESTEKENISKPIGAVRDNYCTMVLPQKLDIIPHSLQRAQNPQHAEMRHGLIMAVLFVSFQIVYRCL